MTDESPNTGHLSVCCSSSSCFGCGASRITRRKFLANAGALAAGGLVLDAAPAARATKAEAPDLLPPNAESLTVQPVLTYEIPERKPSTSWRPWGGLQTEKDLAEEKARIGQELATLRKQAEFPLEILPLKGVRSVEAASEAAGGSHDVLLVYAAGGSAQLIEALTSAGKWNLIFVRHRSGPVYLWYETVHGRFLRKMADEFGQPGFGVQDVVVDNPTELLWRMRAFGGLKNTLGKRIVAVGGPSGWGAGGQQAPARSRDLWNLDIRTFSYLDLGERIKSARQDASLVRQCRDEAKKYLSQKGITLETSPEFVSNAFVLTGILKQIMAEAKTNAITINECMSTIMPLSETTACLPLSLLNDQGYVAFCESDFVVIPSGILLHYISGKPVFLNDPTYPHDGLVTIAHCTAPRKMNGADFEPTRILTHFESDYGAAPKVEMRKGQVVTVLDPDFASRRWMGFAGEVVGNPFLDICRSQVDIGFKGSSERVAAEMRGFHWMVSYGNYLRETSYALKKVGVDWLDLST